MEEAEEGVEQLQTADSYIIKLNVQPDKLRELYQLSGQ
jgi:hypothetical protein